MKQSNNQLPQWDLSDLYSSPQDNKLISDKELLKNISESFRKKYYGKIKSLSAFELYESIVEYEKISSVGGQLISYAFLYYCTEISAPEKAAFYQSIKELFLGTNSLVLFFTLELNALEENHFHNLYEINNDLQRYKPWLRDIRENKKYELSEKEEIILNEKSITSTQAFITLFDQTLAALKVRWEGQDLPYEDILNLMTSSNEEERQKAAHALSDAFEKHKSIFTFIMNMIAKDHDITDQLRGFQSPMSYRNLSNLVDDQVVDSLITTVKLNYSDLSHKYYSLKAKILKKDKLNYWDRNAPLNKIIMPHQNNEQYFSWKEARDIVLDAYESFSPKMYEIGKRFFDNSWIDASLNKSKMSGAFAHPTVVRSHPYLLLNYYGKRRDVITLAHELGHGIHQVLAQKQGELMSATPLTIAETASVFGEQIVFRSLLNKASTNEERLIMLTSKVEDMLNTVVRQIAFCDFELRIHQQRKKGELSSDDINAIWMETQREALGPAVMLDDSYKNYWSYISHFIHAPFYVYSYAFGDCLVNSLYDQYMNKAVEDFENKYIDLLSAGGSKRYDELLEPFGLDAKKQEFWQGGLSMIANLIEEVISLNSSITGKI